MMKDLFVSNFDFEKITILAIVLIIAVVGHEIAHGFMAYKFGDLTAKNSNRLSLNPVRHIDILGTIIVPSVMYFSSGMLFGWAKPVPIHIGKVVQNGGYFAAILVALAGIFYNIILATICFTLLYFIDLPIILNKALFMAFAVNLMLAIFNLYPLPPLDGSKVVDFGLRAANKHNFANLYSSLDRYGFIILIVIMFSPFKNDFFAPIFWVINFFTKLL